MLLLMILSVILGLVSFVGFIWLVVVAFKESALWGILVLFLSPITALIFAFKNWEEAKKPFLVYAGSWAGSILVLIMMFGQMGGFQMMALAHDMSDGEFDEAQVAAVIEDSMDRMEHSGMLTDEDQRQLQAMRQSFNEMREQQGATGTTSRPTQAGTPRTTIQRSSSTATTPLPPMGVDVIPDGPLSFKDAENLVGQVVRVVSTHNREYKGRLKHADANSLLLEVELSAGMMSFELSEAEIESLELVYR